MLTLPNLPYAYDALEPAMSAATLHVHHDKHHRKYVEETNTLAGKRGLADATLEEIIAQAETNAWTQLYNNAAQAWNHAFFWNAMTPQGGPAPALFAPLEDEFITRGAAHFASGWVWITFDDGKLAVAETRDGATLATAAARPLLVCDLWEHAYYLDYKNDRETFLKRWWDEVANWRFAQAQYAAAEAHRDGFMFAKAA